MRPGEKEEKRQSASCRERETERGSKKEGMELEEFRKTEGRTWRWREGGREAKGEDGELEVAVNIGAVNCLLSFSLSLSLSLPPTLSMVPILHLSTLDFRLTDSFAPSQPIFIHANGVGAMIVAC